MALTIALIIDSKSDNVANIYDYYPQADCDWGTAAGAGTKAHCL